MRDRAGPAGSPPQTLRHLAATRQTRPAVVRKRIRRAVLRLRETARAGSCRVADAAPAATRLDTVADPTGSAPAGEPVLHRAASMSLDRVDFPSLGDPPSAQVEKRVPFVPVRISSWRELAFWVALEICLLAALVGGATVLARDRRMRYASSRLRGPRR